MPCVVTQSTVRSDLCAPSESWRTAWSPGSVRVPLPTTILKPSPLCSPPRAPRPDTTSASFGSATFHSPKTAQMTMKAMTASVMRMTSMCRSLLVGLHAHGARRLEVDDDDAGADLDHGVVDAVGDERFGAAAHGQHHLADRPGLDASGYPADLREHVVVGIHSYLLTAQQVRISSRACGRGRIIADGSG